MQGTSDILGHRAAIDRLWGALSRDTLHHAYLFEGPQGVGKHTVGLRLAMAANCTGQPLVAPCGKCPTCQQIQAGSHPDVVSLTPDPGRATPTISVDQVREVVRVAGYHRYNSRRRFFLIDPADRMVAAAANALLKTLEEPPDGTGFILIATHSSSLLPTIVSRCQRVRFTSVPHDALQQWLIARNTADAEVISHLSMGCPGRALELAGGDLKTRRELRDALLQVLQGELPGLFDWSQKLCRGGRADWTPRVEALLALLEDLVRDAAAYGTQAPVPLLNSDCPDVVAHWSRALWPGGIPVISDALRQARRNLALFASGRLVVDAVLTRVRSEVYR